MYGGCMKIVLCLDDNYIKYAKVSIVSYKKQNPKAKIIVASESGISGIGEDESVSIKLPKTFRNRGSKDRISNTAYMRLFLTQLPYDKVIYVDAGTICQKPLKEMWEMPCEYINLCESHNYGQMQALSLNVPKYGLSGMMVMNLENLRKIHFTEKCLKIEETYPTPTTGWAHDETCINVAMKGKLKFIDKKYNYCHNRTYQHPIDEKDAYILHYVGKDKSEMIGETCYGEIKPAAHYIKGKEVAIVGNAKSIFDKRNGKEIDEHETIIRFNRGYIYQPQCQGSTTTILFLACNLNQLEITGYKANLRINRSNHYYNPTGLTISNGDRAILAKKLGAQPSTGFLAIDVCLKFGAKKIDLYGFDFEATPTFYNPQNYVTQHNYSKEKEIIKQYEKEGRLTIH